MATRVIRNRFPIGKRYRVQVGDWYPVNRMTDRSPEKRFHVAYEQDCATLDEARAIAARLDRTTKRD
jgi:hypothetical protein